MGKRIVYHCDKCKRTIQKEDDIYEITINKCVVKGDCPNEFNNIVESENHKEYSFELCKRCANHIWCIITDSTGENNI